MTALGGLLEGIRVLDLTIWRPGPYATQLLAELGADIIKVEPPGGDPMRSYPELFTSLNINKRGIVLDLKDDTDRAHALQLAAAADVVIEGFRPGVVTRLGVDDTAVRAVNPNVIYCSLSGLGQTGDLALVPGHDLNYQAWAGSLAPDGGAPVVPAVPIADLAGGMTAAFAICAAVVRKLRTGEGDNIDVGMADVLATWTGAVVPRADGADPDARGVAGYGTFATRDGGWIALGVLTEDHFWRAVCVVLDIDGDAPTLDFLARSARVVDLQRRVAEAVAKRDRDELTAALQAAGAPAAPVLDRTEMLQLDHLRQRDVVTKDPWTGVATGHPARFAQHPARRVQPAPALDEHRGTTFNAR